MTPLNCLLLPLAAGLVFIAIWDVRRVAEIADDNHDGLSDEQREALRIIRERDA